MILEDIGDRVAGDREEEIVEGIASDVDLVVERVTASEIAVFVGDFCHQLKDLQ